jgi:hypothetical protein
MSNQLRDALDRANKESSHPMSRSLVGRQIGTVVPSPGSMIVERLKINRVDIKIEVSAFVDRHFIARTGNDGTILELSKERLVEGLTDLFSGLEEIASNIMDDEPKRPQRGKNVANETVAAGESSGA